MSWSGRLPMPCCRIIAPADVAEQARMIDYARRNWRRRPGFRASAYACGSGATLPSGFASR